MTYAPLQVARTGLDAQNARMRVIANNLANVNTTAFKRDRAEFQSLAYQQMTAAGAAATGEARYAIGTSLGSGVRLAGTARVMAAGSISMTENPLDLAIEGDGFFRIARSDGSTAYTRAGNFQLSSEGMIVTSDGEALQPEITVPSGATAVTIGPDGTVSANLPGENGSTELGRIELAQFANPAGLAALGGNLYAETGASGAAEVAAPGSEGLGAIRQGALEGSNVNIVQELIDMIETQRAYEINSKMISATDDMLKSASQQL